MLDLFCGRCGVSKAFAARGWECVVVDLVRPPEIPQGCEFIQMDIINLRRDEDGWWVTSNEGGYLHGLGDFDFGWASSPCQEFSVIGMKMFFPNPPFPRIGLKLFNHARELFWGWNKPWVMENVRAAQKFVGQADHHCGPFYLWGPGVQALMPQGIQKGFKVSWGDDGKRIIDEYRATWSGSQERAEITAKRSTIPPELANCVADYAERLLEQRQMVVAGRGGVEGSNGKS